VPCASLGGTNLHLCSPQSYTNLHWEHGYGASVLCSVSVCFPAIKSVPNYSACPSVLLLCRGTRLTLEPVIYFTRRCCVWQNEWPEGQRLALCKNYKFPQAVATPLKQLLPTAGAEGLSLIRDSICWNPLRRPTAQQVGTGITLHQALCWSTPTFDATPVESSLLLFWPLDVHFDDNNSFGINN